MTGENIVAPNNQHFEIRKLAVHGAVSGLFFAQTMSWQHLIDVVIEKIFGVSTDDPWFALWRAVLVTGFTTALAWTIVVAARRCTDVVCSSVPTPSIEFRTE